MSCMNTLRILFICFFTDFMTTQDSYCTIWYCEFLHWLYELRETKVQFVRTASSDMAVIHDKQLKIWHSPSFTKKSNIFTVMFNSFSSVAKNKSLHIHSSDKLYIIHSVIHASSCVHFFGHGAVVLLIVAWEECTWKPREVSRTGRIWKLWLDLWNLGASLGLLQECRGNLGLVMALWGLGIEL